MSLSRNNDAAGSRLITVLALTIVLLSSGIGVAYYAHNDLPSAIPQTQCMASPETITPVAGWHFKLDPDDVGLAQAWFAGGNGAGWQRSAPGAPWEERGYEAYDGIAWYRATYEVPAAWESAYLGTMGVDDTARVWVNGQEVPMETLIELPTGDPVQIAYRIRDRGGLGGIKQPVRVGRQVWAALADGDYVRWLADQHPAWPLPGWARDDYHAWTFTGALLADDEALMSARAAVAPWAEAPLVEFLLLDEDGRIQTAEPDFSLVDDVLPMPRAQWQTADLTFSSTLWARFDDEGSHWLTTVRNDAAQSVEATLLALVRPLAISNGTRPTYAAGFDGQSRLWLDGDLFAVPSRRPQQVGVAALTQLMDAVQDGRVPSQRALDCAPAGDAAAAMAFPLALEPGQSWQLSFAFPAAPGGSVPDPDQAEAQLAQTRQAWQREIDASAADITVPDELVMNAYRASIGYLLVALDSNGPHPGPLAHDALWVRDAAYIGETLLRLGREEVVRAYVPSLLAHQRHDGYVPAIIEAEGPRPDVEWDAQGQLIFLVAELYRYNEDKTMLADWYPHVRDAASFLVSLRETTADDPLQTRGILPPSKSAEDLGSAEWHHYWDDFWAVAGLENAAFVARELGHAEDARWMQQEADALRAALRASIEAVMGPNPAYIPNGPEDTTSSAMARGSANSLYPVEVFPRHDPLIVRSFDEYYQRWIAPQGGGYKHIYGQWWPYGGLELARDYVRLGRHDILHEILGWTLTHQTLPGTFAWAEQVNPDTGGFSGGDMPHAWASSSYIALVQEMLMFQEGEQLELFAGVPGSWLTEGKVVALTEAPTPFGPLTAVTDSTLTIDGDQWQGRLTVTVSGARPPDGFSWRLPHLPQRVEGPPGAEVQDGWLYLPQSGGTVTLVFSDTAESGP